MMYSFDVLICAHLSQIESYGYLAFKNAPQIHLSSLLFAPKHSLVGEKFCRRRYCSVSQASNINK